MLNAIQTKNAVQNLDTWKSSNPQERAKRDTEKNRLHTLFHDYLVRKYAFSIPYELYPTIWAKACSTGYSSYELIESNYRQEAEFIQTIVTVVRAMTK